MNWQLFLSVFTLIFLAELPDKTAFATLLLASRGRAVSVFSGVAVAFLVQTIVAAVFGSLISLLPVMWVHLGTGILFLFFAWQMWRSRNDQDEKADEAPFCDLNFWICTWRAFLVIFIAEWGDLTQITTASLIAKYQNDRATVFVAALCALWAVTFLAVILGQHLKNWMNPQILKKIGAGLFLVMGLTFLGSSFGFPSFQ